MRTPFIVGVALTALLLSGCAAPVVTLPEEPAPTPAVTEEAIAYPIGCPDGIADQTIAKNGFGGPDDATFHTTEGLTGPGLPELGAYADEACFVTTVSTGNTEIDGTPAPDMYSYTIIVGEPDASGPILDSLAAAGFTTTDNLSYGNEGAGRYLYYYEMTGEEFDSAYGFTNLYGGYDGDLVILEVLM